MTRPEFTQKIAALLLEMKEDRPMADWLLRSDMAQNMLFNAGLSKCDGISKRSRHQSGLALDIYFEGLDPDSEKSRELNRKWHKVWEAIGGKPMLEWDCSHYEG